LDLFATRAEDITGDNEDLKRICRHIMNKSASRRLISKQEAMVLLADLPLTECTEALVSVSVNNSRALRKAEEESTDKSFVTAYSKRSSQYEHMSLYDYYIMTKNSDEARKNRKGNKYIIPNFCGLYGAPKYPVTDSYARHTLIVYKPWRKYPTDLRWLDEFEVFINSKFCPKSARMTYDRVVKRYVDKMNGYEPKASVADHSMNSIEDPEDADLLTLVGLHNSNEKSADKSLAESLERGKDFEWCRQPLVRISIFAKDLLHCTLHLPCKGPAPLHRRGYFCKGVASLHSPCAMEVLLCIIVVTL